MTSSSSNSAKSSTACRRPFGRALRPPTCRRARRRSPAGASSSRSTLSEGWGRTATKSEKERGGKSYYYPRRTTIKTITKISLEEESLLRLPYFLNYHRSSRTDVSYYFSTWFFRKKIVDQTHTAITYNCPFIKCSFRGGTTTVLGGTTNWGNTVFT